MSVITRTITPISDAEIRTLVDLKIDEVFTALTARLDIPSLNMGAFSQESLSTAAETITLVAGQWIDVNTLAAIAAE